MYIPGNGTNLSVRILQSGNGSAVNGTNIEGRAFTIHTDGSFKMVANNEEVQAQGIGTVKNGYATLQFGGNYQLINGTGTALAAGTKVIGAPPVSIDGTDHYGVVKSATLTLSNNPTATEVQNITRAKGTITASSNTSSGSGLGARDVDVVNA